MSEPRHSEAAFETVIEAHLLRRGYPERFFVVYLPVPPIQEQRAIAAQTAKLDAMRSATERTIALLKERRVALIAAAVTGHIDVGGTGYYTDDAASHTGLPRRQ